MIMGRDINAPLLEQYLRKIPQSYVIYSGFEGGYKKSAGTVWYLSMMKIHTSQR